MQQINGKIAFGGIAIGKIKEVFKENMTHRQKFHVLEQPKIRQQKN